ncbi:MAG: T9SS type A sorting domain-containing protein [Saprospiraceae bacterium]|nr:T9SS type A sorting domain-containing protein [Bacteroidia bacterium]NNL90688.1 T9SS type A sorting domain-containing protein [Saprospiraceae bacterium]
MRKILLFFTLFCSLNLFSQIPDGQIAPDFNLEDINGEDHQLYDYLDDGYSVILDFSATWCGPCWNYHQTGILENIYGDFGPGGEDKVMVFMIEADPGTTQPCIYGPSGCSGGSIGDWTAGVDYPILNPEAGDAATVNGDFQINYYPTLYGVAPNGEIYEIGQASFNEWESWTAHSFQMHNTTFDVNEEDCTTSFIQTNQAGGEGTVEYEWSNGATTQNLYNIEPGFYSVTMTDDNNYEVVKGPIEIEYNNGADVELVDLANVSCANGSDGMIEVDASGGSEDFEYEWSTGDDTPMLINVPAGDYEVVVTDIGTGCEYELEFELEEPEELEFEYEVFNPDCEDQALGSVEFFVEGGTWPMLYQFDDFESFDEYVTLEPGEYEPTIIDANGCEAYVPRFEIAETNSPTAMSQAIGSFSCVVDTVYVDASNSSSGPNITYNWYDPTDVFVGSGSQVQVDSAGLYTLSVYDATTGCETMSSVMVTEDFSVPTAVVSSSGNIDCNNVTSMISSQGSTADSSTVYTWTTADGVIESPINSPDIEVSAAGMYTLTIDNMYSGCSESASIMIESEDLPELELSGDTDFCDGSSTTLTVTQNPDETPTWVVNGVTVSNDFSIEIMESAEVEVYLTNDITGCEVSDVVQTTAFEAPQVDVSGDLMFCAGNMTTICLDNSSNHNISWEIDGVTFSGECVDLNTSSDITVMITNNTTGCQSSDSFVTQMVELPSIDLIDNPTILDCTNETSTLTYSTDMSISVEWVNENGEVLGINTELVVDQPGEYTAVATNIFGCTVMESVTVEANLDELPIADYAYMAAEYTFTFNDMTEGDVKSRLWDFGDGNTSTEANPVHTYANPGFYKVNLASTNDCGTTTHEEEVLATTPIQVTTASTDVSCFGANDASIQVGVGGGVPGYEYDWQGPGGANYTGTNLSNLGPGAYQIMITDAAGETVTNEVVITEPDAIEVNATVVNSQASVSEGSINLSIVGGTGTYEVTWDNGSNGTDLTGLPQGDYLATIVDGNGCTVEELYTVTGTTNVNEISIINSFNVSPNPAVDYLNVNVDLKVKAQLKISMVSLDGKLLKSYNTNSKTVSQTIDLSTIANGIYLVEVRSQDKVNIKKVVVAK